LDADGDIIDVSPEDFRALAGVLVGLDPNAPTAGGIPLLCVVPLTFRVSPRNSSQHGPRDSD
jgi:hypothetical protein